MSHFERVKSNATSLILLLGGTIAMSQIAACDDGSDYRFVRNLEFENGCSMRFEKKNNFRILTVAKNGEVYFESSDGKFTTDMTQVKIEVSDIGNNARRVVVAHGNPKYSKMLGTISVAEFEEVRQQCPHIDFSSASPR